MRFALSLAALLSGTCLLTGCRTTIQPDKTGIAASGEPPDPTTDTASLDGTWHSVRRVPSERLPDIDTVDKVNPAWWFMNADTPIPPDWFEPEATGRGWKWYLRNPFHNFSFYVIGIADKPFVRSGRYPEDISNPKGGWNFAVSKYKWLRLPYVSWWRGRFEFYAGWRNRGNFGIKISASRPKEQEVKPDLSKAEVANTK